MKNVFVVLLFLAGSSLFAFAILRTHGRSVRLVTRYGPTTVVGDAFPKTLKSGSTVQTLARPPRRVASLTVTADEMLTVLLPPERIAAVTHFADDPAVELSASRAPPGAARIGGADPERVIALEPDLVFVAHYTLESAVRILSAAAIPVVRLKEVRSFADVADNLRLAARAVGEESRGDAVLAALTKRLASIERRTAGLGRVRVLYYSAVGYTSGSDTLVDEKIRLAGGQNVAAEAGLVGYKDVALDVLVQMNPDVIVVPRWSKDARGPVRDLTESPAWRDVSAIRSGRVFALSAALLTSESPEGARGVEELARLLHPEAFRS